VIRLSGGVRNGRENVISLEARVIGKNLLVCRTVGEQFEHVTNTNPHAADARLAAALAGLDRDSLKRYGCHDRILLAFEARGQSIRRAVRFMVNP